MLNEVIARLAALSFEQRVALRGGRLTTEIEARNLADPPFLDSRGCDSL
jgi:hypothetical protein